LRLIKKYTFPNAVGYRFESNIENKYLMAHIDYNYPLLNTNHTLNMELNLKFTAPLRSNNLGMLILGSNYELQSIQISPKSSNFMFTSICHQDCTKVKIFKEFEFIIFQYFQIEITMLC
jgi:hypothetical protein